MCRVLDAPIKLRSTITINKNTGGCFPGRQKHEFIDEKRQEREGEREREKERKRMVQIEEREYNQKSLQKRHTNLSEPSTVL